MSFGELAQIYPANLKPLSLDPTSGCHGNQSGKTILLNYFNWKLERYIFLWSHHFPKQGISFYEATIFLNIDKWITF